MSIGSTLVIFRNTQAAKCSYEYDHANNANIMNLTKSCTPVTKDVAYDVDFINMWSAVNHPPLYPADAHWSPPVIVSHNEKYQMWAEGELASEGVETVAETGNPSKLQEELDDAKKRIGDVKIGSPQFNRQQQSQTITNVKIDKKHPYLSAISMIAPSPDWFSGFYDIVPVTCDGYWYESFTVVVQPYDAGTDSGTKYRSADSDTDPQDRIVELSPATVPPSMVFVNEEDGDVRPVLSFKFSLVNKPRNLRS